MTLTSKNHWVVFFGFTLAMCSGLRSAQADGTDVLVYSSVAVAGCASVAGLVSIPLSALDMENTSNAELILGYTAGGLGLLSGALMESFVWALEVEEDPAAHAIPLSVIALAAATLTVTAVAHSRRGEAAPSLSFTPMFMQDHTGLLVPGVGVRLHSF